MDVTAAIIKKDGRYLICQRAADDECPLLWEFPGGKTEQGETPEQCIKREIMEELAVDIEVKSVFANTNYSFNGRTVRFTFFNCDITKGDIRLNVHNDMRWVLPMEMKEFSFMPADVDIVEMITNN